jgi:hypothetical protein
MLDPFRESTLVERPGHGGCRRRTLLGECWLPASRWQHGAVAPHGWKNPGWKISPELQDGVMALRDTGQISPVADQPSGRSAQWQISPATLG